MLSVQKIKAAAPKEKPYKLPSENGLYLIVYPSGIKGWRHRLRIDGRDTTLSYGNFPEVTLKEARLRRDQTRVERANNIDPVAARRAAKVARANSFQAIAQEWLDAGCPPNRKNKPVADKTIGQHTKRLEKHVYPIHGRRPIDEITAEQIHGTLKRLVSKGTIETAHRVRSLMSRIFRYAVATGRASQDPAAALQFALPSVQTNSFAAITEPNAIGCLLRAIEGYDGHSSVSLALRLAPYVFVRPGELRGAMWTEIDLDAAEWVIPPERMKMDREHRVPLSVQARSILMAAQPFSRNDGLVFPGVRDRRRPISDNSLNAALRRLGYTSDQMTAHGFRSMASTRLNEMGFDPDVIEAQLAHVDQNRIRAIYNRAEYNEKRREMMQSWADYLDALRDGADIVSLNEVRKA